MRYRTLDVRIWCDNKFKNLSPLQPSGQALFLYLLTNPNTTSIPGLYRAGAAAMAEELGWDLQDFQNAFQEIAGQGLVKADFKARVIFILNAIAYNKPQSPNVVRSWASHWDEIPECKLKDIAYHSLKTFVGGLGEAFSKAFDEVIGKTSRKSMPNQEQKQEKEQDKNNCEVLQTSLSVLSKSQHSEESLAIFKYWQTVMSHPKAILDDKRKRTIQKALKSFTIDELKKAIDGCSRSFWHMGNNEQKQKYDGLHLILKDAEHIEKFIALADNVFSSNSASHGSNDIFAGAI